MAEGTSLTQQTNVRVRRSFEQGFARRCPVPGRGRAQGIVGMAIVLPGSSQWGPMSHMWLVTGQALLEGRKPLWGQYCSASCLSETPTPKNCPSPAVPAALGGPARPDGCFPRPVPSLPSHSWGRTFLPALSCHLTVGTGSV